MVIFKSKENEMNAFNKSDKLETPNIKAKESVRKTLQAQL